MVQKKKAFIYLFIFLVKAFHKCEKFIIIREACIQVL